HRGRRGRARKVAHALEHHLRDRIAPHPAFAVVDHPVALGLAVAAEPTLGVVPAPVLAVADIVTAAVVGTADHPQPIDTADDAVHVGPLPGSGVHFLRKVLDVATQDAALQVVGLAASDQAEVHP